MLFIAYKTNFTFTAPAFIIKTSSGFTFTGNKNKAHKFSNAGEAYEAVCYFHDGNASDQYYVIGEGEEIINNHLSNR